VKYDFDLLLVTPKDLQTKYSGLLERFGLTDQAGQQLAMFRHSETTQALAGACEQVRECFVASGFALNGFDSGLDDNLFDTGDEESRSRILAKLQENVEALPGDVAWNGFDIGDFFVSAYGAMPAPRKRKSFGDVRRQVRAPLVLTAARRITPRVLSRPLSRPLSTPAPGL